MIVRAEAAGDAAAIRRVLRAAFPGDAEADLVDALRAEGLCAISLVAEEASAVVGHVLFSPLVLPVGCLALAPLCVMPDRHRRGIGGYLVREGLNRARAEGWVGVFVVGDPAYYGRFGFSVEAASAFKTPYPPDYVMSLELWPGALGGCGETVTHAAPFDRPA